MISYTELFTFNRKMIESEDDPDDGDGSDDKKEEEVSETPGFESIIILGAIVTIIFFKKRYGK